MNLVVVDDEPHACGARQGSAVKMYQEQWHMKSQVADAHMHECWSALA